MNLSCHGGQDNDLKILRSKETWKQPKCPILDSSLLNKTNENARLLCCLLNDSYEDYFKFLTRNGTKKCKQHICQYIKCTAV